MANENKTRDCPYCKEEIKVDAIKCKHCGSSVTPEKPSHKGICPYCAEEIKPDAVKCKHCQSYLIIETTKEHSEHNEMRGLGDAVARITTFFGVKPCSGCKRRQHVLNTFVPFKRSL